MFRSLDTRVLYFVVSHGGVLSFVMKAIIYEKKKKRCDWIHFGIFSLNGVKVGTWGLIFAI